MGRYSLSIPVNSALFRVVDGMIFNRGKSSFRINKILEDTNELNKSINDESRLKDKLFREIMVRFNSRIDKYDLLFDNIGLTDIDKFNIVRYKLTTNGDASAYYQVFPKTFVCNKCGHLLNISENLDSFDPTTCKMEGCDGHYEQALNLLYCEQCGHISPLKYYCSTCESDEYWKIKRPDLSQPSTWEVYCSKCNGKPLDILRLKCNHKVYGNEISKAKPYKYRLLTSVDGAISSPVVITVVDIPNSKFDSPYLDNILLGLYFNKFDSILNELCLQDKNYEDIITKLKTYTLPWIHEDLKGMLDEESLKTSNELKECIDSFSEEFKNISFSNITDYLILSGLFSKDLINSISFDEFINSTSDNDLRIKYDNLKNSFYIENINYISNIKLVSSVIGTNLGINKLDDDFIPHFQPIWEDNRSINSYEVGKFRAYSYPFETEGILFSLDPIVVVNWLIDNEVLDGPHISSKKEALEILFNFKEDENAYIYVKTLLHTLSHLLIRRSSLFTGLDTDSCGELIFVNSTSFLIYSTSNINIGGFYFVFEHSLMDWFKGIEFDISECVLDPNCMHETGACFSCIYLPEFVCSEFNQFLDRDVFLGKHRFNKGFWE